MIIIIFVFIPDDGGRNEVETGERSSFAPNLFGCLYFVVYATGPFPLRLPDLLPLRCHPHWVDADSCSRTSSSLPADDHDDDADDDRMR